MSLEILLFGGRNHRFPQQRPAWDLFEAALLVKIRDGEIVQKLEYEGSALDREVGIDTCFRAATVLGDHAYACTSTEVLKIDLRSFRITEHLSHPLFNDVHHVAVVNGHFFVTSTGIDSVVELDERFQLIRRYPVAKDEIIERFGADADYRRIPSTKPHAAHPNFVETWAGDVWVTNFQTGEVESLTSSRKYPLSENRVHDGVPALGRVWFTEVSGKVIELDPETGTTTSFDLTPMTGAERALGWCRGIAPVSRTDAIVGFSRLRETKVRENLKWLGNKLLGQSFVVSLPTRIARYDLARRAETWRFDLEEHGMNAVFSIHVS